MAPPAVATETKPAPSALPFLFAVAVLVFTYWCVDTVAPALPAIQESLGLSAVGAGLVFSVFFGGRLVTNLPAAWLAERVGPRWTAVCGAVALLVGSAGAAVAGAEALLLPARGLQGAGVALLATAGLLSALRARPERGAAMTAFNVAIGLGGSGGLLAGGLLATEIGWRAVFWLSAGIAAALLAGSLVIRGTPPAPVVPGRTAPDLPERPSRGGETAAVAANLLVFVNYSIWVFGLPLLVATRFGFTAEQTALILLYVNLVHLGGALPAGRAIRALGGRRVLAVGFGLTAAGLLAAPLVPSALWLAAPLGVYAIGQSAGNSAAGDLILRLGGGGGRAVGAVRLSSDVGLVVGPAAAGALADAAGVEAIFVGLGGIALAAMAAVVLVGWRTPRGSGGGS
jgi:MFS family permease